MSQADRHHAGAGAISLDSGIKLSVPEGAVTAPTTVRVVWQEARVPPVEPAEHEVLLSDLLEVSVDGDLQLKVPLLLTFSYPPGVDPEDLVVLHFTDDTYDTKHGEIDLDATDRDEQSSCSTGG